MHTILSLFDYTGNWSKPYRDNGYNVIQIDLKLGIDILTFDYKSIPAVFGILAAVPCTDFAISGARWFEQKDKSGETNYSIKLAEKTLEIINYFNPVFWVVENPMSRIHKFVDFGTVRFIFHPYEFAGYDRNPRDSQYQKQTWLFGRFNIPVRDELPNLDGAKYWKKLWR